MALSMPLAIKREGNTFVVQIPVRREAFKEEEIDESMEYAAYNVLPVGEVEEAVATDMAEREPVVPLYCW